MRARGWVEACACGGRALRPIRFACFWGLSVDFSADLTDTWLVETGYCRRLPTSGTSAVDAVMSSTEGAAEGMLSCRPPEVLYLASLYWSARLPPACRLQACECAGVAALARNSGPHA